MEKEMDKDYFLKQNVALDVEESNQVECNDRKRQ